MPRCQKNSAIMPGEFHCSPELPDSPSNVKEKEAAQIYAMLAGEKQMLTAMRQILESDRREFMAAMESGWIRSMLLFEPVG